jgi:hypothetical protein
LAHFFFSITLAIYIDRALIALKSEKGGPMKKLLMIIPLVILLCFTFGCQQGEETELLLDKEDDDVKIEIENGIQVVYNPKNPSPLPGTPSKLILREELCIGDEEGEEILFS